MTAANVHNAKARKFFNSFSQVLSDDEFYTHLSHLLPMPLRGSEPPKKMFREAEFERIAQLLKLRGKPNWALRPRHYVVLYMTGMEHAMDAIVEENRSDIFLPYQDKNLPNTLKGVERDKFLKYQDNVLTGMGATLERPGGDHQHFDRGSADNLFIYIKTLGMGMAECQCAQDRDYL